MPNVNIYDLADAWNAAGATFTAIKMNVTDTASAAGSLLMDLQVGGASKFHVTKSGDVVLGGDGIGRTITVSSLRQTAGRIDIVPHGNGVHGLGVRPNAGFSGIQFLDSAASIQTNIWNEATNTLAQRNGGNAQAFLLYNTYTDAANYERGALEWSGNMLRLVAQNAGSGAARELGFGTLGSTRWKIATSGHFHAGADAAYDIGGSVANRPRNIYAAGVLRASHLQIADGLGAPAALAGQAQIYVDSADGDLKVVFGDGIIKVLATDT